MHRVALVVPGDLETRTGGYIYDKRIAAGLRRLGWTVDVHGTDLSRIDDGTIVLIDGLALLDLGEAVAVHASRLRLVPLIHLPLGLEIGLAPDEAARRRAIEERALAAAALVAVTGVETVRGLEHYGIERARIALVEPGTDPAPLAHGSDRSGASLLCVAAVTPGKGHERLLRALAAVPKCEWTLTCAGSLDRDPATAGRAQRLVTELGLDERVAFTGELDDERLAVAYDRADVFVLATLRETYGMAVAEAIAHGLPVVSTAVGAIPHIVGSGGLLVPPDDEAALTGALATIIGDARVRYELTERARRARGHLHTWADASAAMAAALERVAR